ncbi:hypothetical protein [Legionella quateirensis]|uniref:Uncharacterized protein n=1 Tax=Legionella quateirensis TaxID=45072 RepID=A0A378KRT3_9GAMM|nr:hypothetical protein [Legionella quateirensis]KTD42509.1 hypothetical protein Lqua_3487 [Legionella quateirensis]STY17036.1 Uncharacterised protein [Legionella quateirensis]
MEFIHIYLLEVSLIFKLKNRKKSDFKFGTLTIHFSAVEAMEDEWLRHLGEQQSLPAILIHNGNDK